jgi:hypothetical protein
MRSVGRLHAGIAVALVVEHHDREVRRALHGDRGETAETHEQLAVAGDHEDPSLGLREREAEADHSGPAHRAPERKVQRAVAGRGDVPSGAAEPRDHEQIARVGKELLGEFAPAEGRPVARLRILRGHLRVQRGHRSNDLAPIRR